MLSETLNPKEHISDSDWTLVWSFQWYPINIARKSPRSPRIDFLILFWLRQNIYRKNFGENVDCTQYFCRLLLFFVAWDLIEWRKIWMRWQTCRFCFDCPPSSHSALFNWFMSVWSDFWWFKHQFEVGAMAPCGLSVSWMWPKVDILLEGSFANLPRLIPKLKGANVVCAGASLTTPGLLSSLIHPLLGALTWNQKFSLRSTTYS